MNDDIDTFRADTAAWLQANCPAAMRTPISSPEMLWSSAHNVFISDDQRLWFERTHDLVVHVALVAEEDAADGATVRGLLDRLDGDLRADREELRQVGGGASAPGLLRVHGAAVREVGLRRVHADHAHGEGLLLGQALPAAALERPFHDHVDGVAVDDLRGLATQDPGHGGVSRGGREESDRGQEGQEGAVQHSKFLGDKESRSEPGSEPNPVGFR